MLDRATLLVANMVSAPKLSLCAVVFPIAAVVSLSAMHPRVLPTTHVSCSRLFSWVDYMSVRLQEIVGRYLRQGKKECLN